jgi:hemerythrin-like domain-containing protein
MRTEHRTIADCLEAIHQKVQANNPDSDLEEQRLIDVLKSHNMKEERILYPSIDQVISDQERAELYQAMKDIPEERYRTCCRSERS